MLSILCILSCKILFYTVNYIIYIVKFEIKDEICGVKSLLEIAADMHLSILQNDYELRTNVYGTSSNCDYTFL